jgi:hypothetical protein
MPGQALAIFAIILTGLVMLANVWSAVETR